jgi:outer membrane protein assembly factor BamB
MRIPVHDIPVTPPSRGRRLAVAGIAAALAATVLAAAPSADNWPEWRGGPKRDGRSAETKLPASWAPPTTAKPAGENLAWRVEIGSRSTPVVWGNRVYVYAPSGDVEHRQERLVALDAATGKVAWERRFPVYLTDIPAHRVAWASPSVDPKTGNIFTFGGNSHLRGFSPDGTLLWERSLIEDFGAITTHGGRAVSPVVDGDLVIVSTLISAWGQLARGGNRYFAFDTKTGHTVWVSSPQQRHWDTNYSTAIIASVNGVRLAIVGGTDGVYHAIKVATGEPVWKFDVSKRAINNSLVMVGTDVVATHSEENFDTNEMGLITRFDGGLKGEIKKEQAKWFLHGVQIGFPTPVADEAAGMLYAVDNGAILMGIDLASGRTLWTKKLGTLQKGSPVLADGKLYVGTENGRFFILRPSKTGVEVLDDDALPISQQEGTGGAEPGPESIWASPAVANGRIYVASMDALYAIGPKALPRPTNAAPAAPPAAAPATPGPATAVRVFPSDVTLKPGQAQKFAVSLFDEKGIPVPVAAGTAIAWAADGLKGTAAPDGTFTPDAAARSQGGTLTATVGALKGVARVRVAMAGTIEEDFESYTGEAPPAGWINATNKFDIKALEGSKVLQRREDQTLTRRARMFFGAPDMKDYTVEMDVRTTERRRQQGDVGVIAQRYVFVLFGNSQKVELQPWQPNVALTVAAPFQWKGDTWYRVKLEVKNLPDGKVRARAKAWPRGEAEPAAWLVEKLDEMGHGNGAPGLYADAPWGASYDNIKVY